MIHLQAPTPPAETFDPLSHLDKVDDLWELTMQVSPMAMAVIAIVLIIALIVTYHARHWYRTGRQSQQPFLDYVTGRPSRTKDDTKDDM